MAEKLYKNNPQFSSIRIIISIVNLLGNIRYYVATEIGPHQKSMVLWISAHT